MKDIIRRSKENISAVEVEAILVEHPKLKVVVVPVLEELRGEEFNAYLVLKAEKIPETTPLEECLAFTRERLAYYKIPSYWEYVRDLPCSPSECVEKHKLIVANPDLHQNSFDAVDYYGVNL